jgi:hypothetical protein
MEEVVGSIPTRSTKSPNNSGGAQSGIAICVMSCVCNAVQCCRQALLALRFRPHAMILFPHAIGTRPAIAMIMQSDPALTTTSVIAHCRKLSIGSLAFSLTSTVGALRFTGIRVLPL